MTGDPARRYRNALLLGFVVLAALAVLGAALMMAALRFQTDAQAFATGETYWYKGMAIAIYRLDHYAEHGRPSDLSAARGGLVAPRAYLQARKALERSPPDVAAARRFLLSGGNAPRDVPGMIRLYRYFRWTPAFERAIALWRESDQYVRRLVAIAEEMEAAWDAEPPDRAVLRRLSAELDLVHAAVRPLARRFSEAMLDASHALRWTLSLLVAGMAVLFVLVAVALFHRQLVWLRRRDRRFHAAFEQAGVGMAQVGLDGRVLDANPALCSILRQSRRHLAGRRIGTLVHPEDVEDGLRHDQRLIDAAARSYTAYQRYRRGDGSVIWAKLTVALIRGDDGTPEQFIYIVEDVTEARTLADRLEFQATHDELTGLYNRRAIERRLELALEQAHQAASTHVLCFIDVDQFKVVNDTCGHLAGDGLLRHLAGVFGEHLRGSDVLGRLGGDEFAVLLHNCSLDAGHQVAGKLREALAEYPFQWESRSFRLTVSVGLAEITERAPDVASVLRCADTACQLAKDDGRDRVRAYLDSDEAIAAHYNTLEWVGAIRSALANDRVILAAQRIEAVGDGNGALHYEVLVRLVDEQGTVHAPGAFMPAAERYRLVTEIDQRVVELVLRFLADHPEHLARVGRCHINASGQSLSSQAYREFVGECIRHHSIPGEKLCFEITETAAVANMRHAQAFFSEVQALGCRIALDDFGSGLSSFGYLKNLPVDVLKIDGTFVRDIARDPHDLAMVRAINEVGKALGKVTVAEFVESAEALAAVRELGVDFVQGYGIHEPCPLAELAAGVAREYARGGRPRR